MAPYGPYGDYVSPAETVNILAGLMALGNLDSFIYKLTQNGGDLIILLPRVFGGSQPRRPKTEMECAEKGTLHKQTRPRGLCRS